MWFWPLQMTVFVHVHMHAANLDPTKFPSSQSPIFSITAMALENSAFVWMSFSKSNVSSTRDRPNCLKTYSLVYLALSLNSAFGCLLPVFSSNRVSFLSMLLGSSREFCTPVLRFPAPGAGARTSLIDSSRTVGAKCHGRSPSDDDQVEHSLYDRHARHTSFPSVCRAHLSKFCHAIIPFDPEPGCRYQRESGPSPEHEIGENTGNPSCRSRISKCRMYSTSSFGVALSLVQRNICDLSTT